MRWRHGQNTAEQAGQGSQEDGGLFRNAWKYGAPESYPKEGCPGSEKPLGAEI